MSFSKIGLNEALTTIVEKLGYSEPTPIQQGAIGPILDGYDVLAAAQTGTGKTAAFTLPIVQVLNEDGLLGGRHPKALVLTPTRELAAQVAKSVETYAGKLPLRSTVIYGGVSAVPQVKTLRRGIDVLIATPGRLLDHVQQGNVKLSEIEIFVLDEADRMLDMGFIPDIRRVIEKLPEDRQSLLFSATFSPEIRKLAKTFLHEPKEIDVAPANATADLIEQKRVFVAKDQKREFLSWLIGKENWKQVLIFTRTKHGANRLCKQLITDGLPSAALHGNKSQGARTKALADFKANRIRCLVATDIAARGLDISQLPHVINYELPNVPEDYVHRIGRTGRAGVNGEALALVCGEEHGLLKDIEKLLGRPIPELVVEDYLLRVDKVVAPAKKPNQRNRRNAGGGARRGKSSNRSGRSDGSKSGRSRGAKSSAAVNGGNGGNGQGNKSGQRSAKPARGSSQRNKGSKAPRQASA